LFYPIKKSPTLAGDGDYSMSEKIMNQKSQTSQILYREPTKAEQIPSVFAQHMADIKDWVKLMALFFPFLMGAILIALITAKYWG